MLCLLTSKASVTNSTLIKDKGINMNNKPTKQGYTTCRYCGKPLDHHASYCGSCGIYIFQLPSDLPGNRPWIEDTLGTCDYCSKPVPLDRKYCIYCGAPLHLSESQRESLVLDRTRNLDFRILFHLENMGEKEKERFKETIRGYRMVEFDSDPDCVRCDFSFRYDEPSSPFSEVFIYRMIRSLLLDLGKEFPMLRAEAHCSYQAKVINLLKGFDDMGGYMTITLSEGKVEEEETPNI